MTNSRVMDEKKLDFSLPETSTSATAKASPMPTVLLILVALLVAANLLISLLNKPSSPQSATSPGTGTSFSADSLKQLALKMEKQSLQSAAAGAWTQYLETADLNDEESAKIWYRIGKLHQDSQAYELALDAFYRSESLHSSSELASEIGRRTQESLESLGKFAALKHELAERVSMDSESAKVGDDVVAEIGAQKITRTELDQQIEANIENQLAHYAAQLPDEDRKRQKEAMLKQFSSDQQRLQFLNSYIVQEILYRKARESKLTENPKVRAQLRDAERGLLAQQMMATELAGQINITDGDLTTYYEANKANYLDPERAKISHILAADEAKATELAAQVRDMDAAAFAELAKQHSTDESTKDQGGELSAEVTKGTDYIGGIGQSADALTAIFETAAGKAIAEPVKTDRGYHVIFVRERIPQRQKSYEEAQREVYQALRTRKEREVQEKLMDQLRDQYNVVIHQNRFKSATEPEEN